MFSHILKIKKEGASKIDQRLQQNVSQSINLNENSFSLTNSGMKTSEFTQKKPQPKQVPRRLKLKDYMRLNEISKEKRSRSAQCLKMESNQKLNKSYELNLRTTFGKADLSGSVKKIPKNFTEQTSLQRFQLMKTVQKIKDKFNRLIVLIEQTAQQFSTYNDLVFMFRIEEVLNDYIKKGIQKITDSYKEHLQTNPIDGIEKKDIQVRLERMFTVRNTQSLQKAVLKADLEKLESLKNLEGEKQPNFNILPVSVSMQSPNKSVSMYNSRYSLKKTT